MCRVYAAAVSIYGVGSTITEVQYPFYDTQKDVTKTSSSVIFAVFPHTFIGVKICRQWCRVKVSDCCAFFFSFWLEHFGVSLEHFKWHWRPHCYNHSSDIRQWVVKDLERAVWDVIKNPGWIFFEKHPSRNKRRNEMAGWVSRLGFRI
jgi:hypothetical protein